MLEDVDPRLGNLIESLRRVIKRSIPGVVEQLKWGDPTYSISGKNVACIMHYSDHVNLGFFMGSKLESKRLEGTGKGLRHIKARSKSDIDDGEFSRLLRKAVGFVK